MSLLRILPILVLVFVAVWWFRRMQARRQAVRAQRMQQALSSERMPACEHCGLHVPESEGVTVEGHFFCSEAHRRLGRKA
ncbi:MAG: PP0621 family protein [Rhodocyclaceae bacterium]|nr:PP0621 family protein [Rhodocyclaceae bacterium]